MSKFKMGLWESLSCLVLGLLITLVGVVPEVHAETIEISCKSSKIQGVDKYLIDTKNKKVKSVCDNCPWYETLYWGDDYIVFHNHYNLSSLGKFSQMGIKVLERDTLNMITAGVSRSDFIWFGSSEHVGNLNGLRCSEGS